MDYNLYIILQEEDLETVGISEIQANWGGENIPYDPRRFESQDKVKMVFAEYKVPTKTENLVGENQVTLKVADGLHELEWEVNKQAEILTSNNIIKMLQEICKLEKFIICIFADDEIIERQIKYSCETSILLLVSEALNWESPQNIEVFCE